MLCIFVGQFLFSFHCRLLPCRVVGVDWTRAGEVRRVTLFPDESPAIWEPRFFPVSTASEVEKSFHVDLVLMSALWLVQVEMVYSLLSMLGTHDKDDMSRTLLAMSSSQDSCIAMRQSGCLPLLIQLLHGNDKDSLLLGEPSNTQQRPLLAGLHASPAALFCGR